MPRPVSGFAAFVLAGLVCVSGASAQSDETWQALKGDVFGDSAIEADSPMMDMTAPTRAEDAAMVPIDIKARLPEGDTRTIETLTLIVDENPAPVAATFTFGPERRDVAMSTRLRVNSYSHIRAIAQTSDGALHMVARFVKASGGCSAPALKDEDEALARLGEMRLRPVGGPAAGGATMTPLSQAQLMIRHPNYSGLQMNQLTRLYIPAKFVSNIVVRQGDDLVFEMEGGISLSEDPAIRFNYASRGEALEVTAEDTDGKKFSTVLSAEDAKS